jgi:hypothetical protein
MSYCFKMIFWILESFSNWFEVIWIAKSKVIKEIRKQKRKRRKEEKNRNGPRGRIPARNRSQPVAQITNRNGILYSFFISLTCGPHQSVHGIIFFLQRNSRWWPSPRHRDRLPSIPLYSLPDSKPSRAYKTPLTLLSSSPLLIPTNRR